MKHPLVGNKIWLKERCPRCNGNLYVERDFNKVIEHCLSCGRTFNLDGSDIKPLFKIKDGGNKELHYRKS